MQVEPPFQCVHSLVSVVSITLHAVALFDAPETLYELQPAVLTHVVPSCMNVQVIPEEFFKVLQ